MKEENNNLIKLIGKNDNGIGYYEDHPLPGTWFDFNKPLEVKVPEIIKKEVEEREKRKETLPKNGFFRNSIKKAVSFLTLLVIGYNTLAFPRALLGTETKKGFVDGNKKTEFKIDRNNFYSLKGEGLYNVLDLDSNKFNVVEIKDNLENKIEEFYAKDVLSFSINNKKIVVKKDFNDNYFLKDFSYKREIKIDLKPGEAINDIYAGKLTYLMSKNQTSDFSKILIYDDLKNVGKVEFYTGQSSVKDFEVKEGKAGVESILLALDNNQIRRLERVGKKYKFANVWKMDYLKNDVVSSVTEIGSYILFGTENGQIGFFKKDNVNEVYFLKLNEENKFPVKELKINSVKYDKKTKKTTVDFSVVRTYGIEEYSVKL